MKEFADASRGRPRWRSRVVAVTESNAWYLGPLDEANPSPQWNEQQPQQPSQEEQTWNTALHDLVFADHDFSASFTSDLDSNNAFNDNDFTSATFTFDYVTDHVNDHDSVSTTLTSYHVNDIDFLSATIDPIPVSDRLGQSGALCSMSTSTPSPQLNLATPALQPSTIGTSSASTCLPTTSSTSSSPKKRSTSTSSPDETDERISKRQRNTEAARRYRQRKVDRVTELEEALAAMTKERDDLRLKLARSEAEADVLRGMVEKRG